MPIFWSDSWTMYNLKRVRWCVDLIEMWEVSSPWGQVNRLGVGVMSHIIFMGLGEAEVGALNSYEGKGGASLKKGGQSIPMEGVDHSTILYELPTYFSLFWYKEFYDMHYIRFLFVKTS